MTLNDLSKRRLVGVHPDLARVVLRAAEIDAMPFQVLEGVRTLEKQKKLVEAKASTTLRSRHIPARTLGGAGPFAHAVDLGAYIDFDEDGDLDLRWDWGLYISLAEVMKVAAHDVHVPLECGADWKVFKDGPHFQLPWDRYPVA
jgi:peptidoglycan L-alanyl-D-glutamate endopeptidase CwlK